MNVLGLIGERSRKNSGGTSTEAERHREEQNRARFIHNVSVKVKSLLSMSKKKCFKSGRS
ncbi:hypothetical protein ACI8B_30052 [Acinetobacter proteolyticus]|uniref:Uncharacterized protein n=1 Tax=Acinetobacter proteolyticus TaxID=1776741 RepID=A0A653K819_9GAMM|nr:hypothetical protein ACI8B_30052 [Acinetobacter proteolyticus]